MAYPKITVNTGLSIEVIASDTLPIPYPGLSTISGTNGTTTANKLVDTNKTFITDGVSIGDIIYNTTDNTTATVSSVDSETVLSVSVNIMALGETYVVYLGGPSQQQYPKSAQGCLLYIGSSEASMDVAKSFVDVKVKTTAGSIVTFSNFPVGEYLPVQVLQLFSTGTDSAAINNSLAIW
tara:strand:+ start:1143 stop:1682 length:540 start_codon:yes stop_codon:yes gene_type:complete